MKVRTEGFIQWVNEQYGVRFGNRCKKLLGNRKTIANPNRLLDKLLKKKPLLASNLLNSSKSERVKLFKYESIGYYKH